MLEDERPGVDPGRRVVALGLGVLRVLGLRLALEELRVPEERPRLEPGRWLERFGVTVLLGLVPRRLPLAGVWLALRSDVDAVRLLGLRPVEPGDLG